MTGSVLCFDYGLKNIGVAVGNAELQTASELAPIKARDGVPDWQVVQNLLNDWQSKQVLVGNPLNMDGSDSELSRRALKFGNRLHGRFGVVVTMVDERLSTREAKSEAFERNHKGNYRQDPIDSIAARIILQTWYQLQNDLQSDHKTTC